MSSVSRQKLAEIGNQIREILQEKEALKRENEQLKVQMKALATRIEQEKLIKNRQEENDKLIKLAKHLETSGGEKESLKKQIDSYLGYIDKCLEMLKK